MLKRRGPTECRVEDVTTEAGTAKGNFYRYFPTWDDLLLAVRDHLQDEYRQELESRYAERAVTDWWAALDEEIDRFLSYQLDLGPLHEVVFHGPAARRRPIDKRRSAGALVAWFIAGGIAGGAFTDVDVDATAALCFHLFHGAADEIASGKDEGQIRRATHQMIHRVLAPEALGAAHATSGRRRSETTGG